MMCSLGKGNLSLNIVADLPAPRVLAMARKWLGFVKTEKIDGEHPKPYLCDPGQLFGKYYNK